MPVRRSGRTSPPGSSRRHGRPSGPATGQESATSGPDGSGTLAGPMAAAQKSTIKPIASNRRARHEYTVLDTVEAGLVLTGSEVKSLREGTAQLSDAFARFNRNELWLEGMHIAPFKFAVGVGAHDPNRPRKL